MKRQDQDFLKKVFYKYWMERVPELDEGEAIDHLDWDLRTLGYIPQLKNCRTSRETKKRLQLFLKEKGIT